MSGHRRLSTSILRMTLGVVIAVLLVAFGLSLWQTRAILTHQFEQRALGIARTVAAEPAIARAVARDDPTGSIQSRAEAVRRDTGALFVVVTDDRGIRFSHPNSDLLGKEVSTDPEPALHGDTVVAMQRGTLGLSARAKVPLRLRPGGAVVGEVSVGIDAHDIDATLWRMVPRFGLYAGIALAVGVIGSLMLARRLKEQTLGLELDDITAMLREREAMLHGIAEGMIGVGADGRVAVINDEARRLLNVRAAGVGMPVADLVCDGRVRDLLSGAVVEPDAVVFTDAYCLVVNRMPISRQGRDLGAVITLADRTEAESLTRELDSVRGLTDALRAQQHEFANRVHALSGMLELGRYAEATEYAAELSGTAAGLAAQLQQQIASPQLVGLLVAKSVVADERGVRLELSERSELAEGDADPRLMLTVLGNLIDNAIDAAAGAATRPARVYVDVRAADDVVRVAVHDTGPGVPAADVRRVFDDGFTTKPAGARRRGYGLALVHRLVAQNRGDIAVAPGAGATFTVTLPRTRTPKPPVPAAAPAEAALAGGVSAGGTP